MSKPKMAITTDAVLRAQKRYPELIESIKGYFGDVPYMKQTIDYRRRDKALLLMTPDDMAALARTDPAAAEAAAQRISELEAKAPPLPPGMGEVE